MLMKSRSFFKPLHESGRLWSSATAIPSLQTAAFAPSVLLRGYSIRCHADAMMSSVFDEGCCGTSRPRKTISWVLQAYSSLGTQWVMRGIQPNPVFDSALIKNIAQHHNVSSAQVVLRWGLQHGQVCPCFCASSASSTAAVHLDNSAVRFCVCLQAVIPASTSQSHIRANLDVFNFVLSDLDMRLMDALDGSI